MRVNDCRHFCGVQKVCSAGIDPMEHRTTISREEQARIGSPFTAVWPCSAHGAAYGLTCDKRVAATAEDVAAEDAEIERVVEAVLSGKCAFAGCTETLSTRGNWRFCPTHGTVAHMHKRGRHDH